MPEKKPICDREKCGFSGRVTVDFGIGMKGADEDGRLPIKMTCGRCDRVFAGVIVEQPAE